MAMKALTQTEKDRFTRTTYAAIDSVLRLVDYGVGGEKTERALEALRELASEIQCAPMRTRKH